MTRYLECPICKRQVKNLYDFKRGEFPADGGPAPLVCPTCKADGATFVAYESSGSYR